MKRGYAYEASLPAADIVELIAEGGRQLGYTVVIDSLNDSATAIHLRNPARLTQRLWQRLPEKVHWQVCCRGEASTITCDIVLGPAYLKVILLLSVLCAIMGTIGTSTLAADWRLLTAASLYSGGSLLLGFLLLIFVVYRILLGGGEERLSGIIGSLRLRCVQVGGSLTDAPSRRWSWHLVRVVSYLIFIIGVCAVCFATGARGTVGIPWWVLTLLLALLAGGALMGCAALPMMLKRRAFGRRLIPGLSGITTAMALLILLCAQFPWIAGSGSVTNADRQRLHQAHAIIAGTWQGPLPVHENSKPVAKEEIVPAYRAVTFWSRACIAVSLLLIGLAAGFFYLAAETSYQSLQYVQQLSSRPSIPWSVGATRAKNILPSYRVVWVAIWAVLSLAFVWELAYLANTTGAWLHHEVTIDPNHVLNTVELSIFFTHLAFGLVGTAPWLDSLVQAAWLLYLSLCWLLLVSSVGQIALQDARLIHASRIRFIVDSPGHRATQCVRAVWQRVAPELRAPLVVLSASSVPYASARCAGLLKGRKVIEVSETCLQLFGEDELEALLAHEIAHHVCGHARKDQLLRFLGRLTFFGDAFVRSLEDTFGQELEADRFAVARCGAKRTALVRCLYQLRNMAALGIMSARTPVRDATMAFGNDSTLNDVPQNRHLEPRRRFRLVWRTYIEQYCGSRHSGYWHPSVELRIDELERQAIGK